ncbi:substrate-binding domain-containing protein [Pontiella agarivorans]|uniref:Substrate-binding domain-containing protein n=1 Tax=Pontiella agarivorans TaxID=3038953 RepID=A0ABU5MSW5_9BACT|nr:substrate-binding domain-containing protein [Pontiella agarivorans]MDZ8117227.1 substrate-binding domain-containing protein [Pontiella agarivorans]
MSKTVEIALAMNYANPFVRKAVEGIARYTFHRGNWRFFAPHGAPEVTLAELSEWKGGGVIGMLDRQSVSGLRKRGIPAVNIFGRFSELPETSVVVDNQEIARMAAEYFIHKGIRRFAITGRRVFGDATLKYQAYLGTLAEYGFQCLELKSRQAIQNLGAEIQTLEGDGPVGVFATEDPVGRVVIDACSDHDLRVPEEVSVLGVNNDLFACEMLHPQMSSIELSPERIGWQAAKMLDELMQGGRPPEEPVRISPERIVERHSTDLVAVGDRVVGDALRFIRDHAHQSILVDDVARAVHVARRTLEHKFRNLLCITVHDSIRRERIARACRLLKETDMLVEELAESCGYTTRERFNQAFRTETGTTPSGYRKRYRFTD